VCEKGRDTHTQKECERGLNMPPAHVAQGLGSEQVYGRACVCVRERVCVLERERLRKRVGGKRERFRKRVGGKRERFRKRVGGKREIQKESGRKEREIQKESRCVCGGACVCVLKRERDSERE